MKCLPIGEEVPEPGALFHVDVGINRLHLLCRFGILCFMEIITEISRGASRLAELAAAQGLRGQEMAATVGCSQPHMSRLLSGLRMPSRRLMKEFQTHYGIDPAEWLERQP